MLCHLLAGYEFWIWARRWELDKERKQGNFSHA
jgi:hypothetical protein